MLVLSRKKEETIHLPELNITIKIVEIRGNVTRVGIEAPRQYRVIRGEHYDEYMQKKAEEEANAAKPGGTQTDAVENDVSTPRQDS